MTTKNLDNLGLQQLSCEEMKRTSGGMTTEELIQMCWDATPDGCNATFKPFADGWDNGFEIVKIWGSLPECGCY